MNEEKRSTWLVGLLLAVVVVGGLVWYRYLHPARPEPAIPEGGIYWTGPMRSKSNPNIYGDEGGQRVEPPPGAAVNAGRDVQMPGPPR